MPKITELVGYGFAVNDVLIPDTDEHGQPRDDGHGKPAKQLLLGDPKTGDTYRFSLTEQGRQELVRKLTGGITLPSFEIKH